MSDLNHEKLKKFSVRLTLVIASIILLLKLGSYFLTNSMAVLGMLLDSTMDILLSLINFFAIYHASRPPDHDHRYGHGKSEALAALAQGAFIAGFGIVLLYEMSHRLLDPVALTLDPIGIGLMGLSTFLVLMLTLTQKYVIEKTGSIAIKADYIHYRMDFWLNVGVFASLFITFFSGFMMLDSLIGILVALYLLKSVKKLLSDAINILMDRELPQKERLKIVEIVTAHPECQNIHDLKTRHAGNHTFIEFHLEMQGSRTLHEIHKTTDVIESLLKKYFSPLPVSIIIHQEPSGLNDVRYHEVFETRK